MENWHDKNDMKEGSNFWTSLGLAINKTDTQLNLLFWVCASVILADVTVLWTQVKLAFNKIMIFSMLFSNPLNITLLYKKWA